jgi:hypothetical protein
MKQGIGVSLKAWLFGWGVLALIAIGVPHAVSVGMYLIFPGTIQVAAPTIFMYSAAFAVIRHLLPARATLLRDVAAAVLTVAFGCLIALPGAVAGRVAFGRANLPEVQPVSPVKLGGKIRLELPRDESNQVKPGFPNDCGPLCAALLDTPGVESVALAETGHASTAPASVYRLVSRHGDRSNGVYPGQPEKILDELPGAFDLIDTNGLDASQSFKKIKAHEAAKKKAAQAVAAGWGLRLVSEQKLVAQRTVMQADQTVRVTHVQDRDGKGVSITRVEVLDRSGKALLRRSIVVGSALSLPAHFTAVGYMENLHVGEARDTLSNTPLYASFKPIPELFLHSSLARPRTDSDLIDRLVDRLRVATSNPALPRTDPDFGLADFWIRTIDWQQPLPADQLAVLGSLIADERIPVPEGMYDGADAKVAPELRSALGSRILDASTPPHTRSELAHLLAQCPTELSRSSLPRKRNFFVRESSGPPSIPCL